MTVTNNTRRILYMGDGVTTLFPVPFRFLAAGDLRVVRAVNEVETTLIANVDYTVAGANNPAGGSVTTTVAPAAGARLLIKRVTTREQPIDFTPFDPFPAEAQERGLDRGILISQEDGDDTNRSLRAPETEVTTGAFVLPPISQRAGKFFIYDGAGNPAVASGTGTDAALRNDLAVAASGAALIGYQLFAGTARSVLAKLGDFLPTPQDDGAIGDGATNDAAALALANTRAVANGKPVVIRATHYIASAVAFTAPVVLDGGSFTGPGSVSFAGGVTGRPYYAFDVNVTGLGPTLYVHPEWFGARRATTVATGIGTKSWNAWPAFITGANFLGSPGHDFGDGAYLAANKPFVAGVDTWDMIAYQRAVFAIGLNAGTILMAPATYYWNRHVRWTCNSIAALQGAGILSSYITSSNWAAHARNDDLGAPFTNCASLLWIYQNGPTTLCMQDFCLNGETGYLPTREGGTAPIVCIAMLHTNGFAPQRIWMSACEAGIVQTFNCSDMRTNQLRFEFCSYGVYSTANSEIKLDCASWWQSWVYPSTCVHAPSSRVTVRASQAISYDEPFNVRSDSMIDCDVVTYTDPQAINIYGSRLDRATVIYAASGLRRVIRVLTPVFTGFRLTVTVGGTLQLVGSYGAEIVVNVSREAGAVTGGIVSNTEWGHATAQSNLALSVAGAGGGEYIEVFMTVGAAGDFSGTMTAQIDGGGYKWLLAA